MKRYIFVFFVISVFLFANVCFGNVEVKFLDKTFVWGTAAPITEAVDFTALYVTKPTFSNVFS
jgi:hypothetical protein